MYYASLWNEAEKAKVLPEIYSMGYRSNYTISVDTATGWLMWGDIGPDESRDTEELNVTAKAGFFGWPYFARSKRTDAADTVVQNLPPAIPATFEYYRAAAIAGPISHTNSSQLERKNRRLISMENG